MAQTIFAGINQIGATTLIDRKQPARQKGAARLGSEGWEGSTVAGTIHECPESTFLAILAWF